MARPAAVLVDGDLMGRATHQAGVLVDGKVHYVSGLVERYSETKLILVLV